MEIHLIRHTRPAVSKGICYGQSDLDVVESFTEEAMQIRQYLPEGIERVYSSPLQRCSKLARYLFPEHEVVYHDHLMEINCGEWEMREWDAIPAEEIKPWMDNFVHVTIPGGENYIDLYKRVTTQFDAVVAHGQHAAIVTHGGVIRSILTHITGTALADSFTAFSLHYSCVVKIMAEQGELRHEVLYNFAGEAETHKPSYY